jgi:hypothetical protein
MSPPDNLDRLSQAELNELVVKQWEQIVELQQWWRRCDEMRG